MAQLIYTKSGTPYMDAYAETEKKYAAAGEKWRKEQSALRDAFRQQATEQRDTQSNKANTQYDSSGRQNYINYAQAQKQLPNQLNSLGIRGGATESSLIRLGNTYGTNVANNEAARNSALNDIATAYTKSLNDYDNSYRSNLADYELEQSNRLAEAFATAYQNQINWEREAQQKDLEYFSGVIDGLYKDKKAYQNLIAQLQASDDPNKDYKIMLATRAMNAIAGSGGGGGGSSRSRGYSSGGSGSGSGSGSLSAAGLEDPIDKIISAAKKTEKAVVKSEKKKKAQESKIRAGLKKAMTTKKTVGKK